MPCWLACRQGLAAARCHTYSSSSTLVESASAFSLLTTPSFWLGWGLIQQPQAQAGEQQLQRQRGEQPLPRRGWRCGGAARVLDACLVLGHCSSVLLVLESALDNLGLGATAGPLNPLDVLVILVGCQDCLHLRVCDLKESGFIWVNTSTIALSC